MKQLILILSILILTSCGVNRHLASSTTPSDEIHNVDYFKPLSYIQFVEKGNKAALSDSLSTVTSDNLSLLLDKHKSSLRLGKEIFFPNDTIKAKVEEELAYLIRVVSQQKKLDGIPLPETIGSILKNNNQRFA